MWRIEKTNIDLHELGTLANWMVKSLPQQVTIGITGTLGAGKTTLVQLLSAAAGIDRTGVRAPPSLYFTPTEEALPFIT